MQLDLFPDALQVEVEALAALAQSDLPPARRRLDQARAIDARLPNLPHGYWSRKRLHGRS